MWRCGAKQDLGLVWRAREDPLGLTWHLFELLDSVMWVTKDKQNRELSQVGVVRRDFLEEAGLELHCPAGVQV